MPAHIFPNLAMNELANKARMAREETDADVAAAKRRRKIGGGGADIDVTVRTVLNLEIKPEIHYLSSSLRISLLWWTWTPSSQS